MEPQPKSHQAAPSAAPAQFETGGTTMAPPAFSLSTSPAQMKGGVVQKKDPAAATTMEKLRKALDDDKESEAISLFGQLSEDECRSVLNSADYKSLAVSAFNNAEMAKAMKAAGVAAAGKFLDKRLEWMFEEGTDWDSLREVVSTGADRTTLYGNAGLLKSFVGELNNKEMAELVDLLGGSLMQKLTWMKAEGANYDQVRAKVVATTDLAQRKELYNSVDMRALFVDVCNNKEMAEMVDLLGGALFQKLNWMKVEGSDIDLVRAKVVNTKDLEQRKALYGDKVALALFVDVCNNKEMAEMVDLLGGTLTQKLTWMKAEGSDFKLVKAKVTATTDPAERAALYGNKDILDLMMDVCSNDTMAEMVKAVGGTLNQKLTWMVAEGTNIDLVGDIVRHAPKAELAGVTTDPVLMDALKSELSSSGFKTLNEMLVNDQLWAGEVTGVTDIGSKHTSDMRHTRSDISINKKINFVEKGKFGPGGFAAMKLKAFNSIGTYLDNKFKVKIEPQNGGSPASIDGVYPIRVSASDDSSGESIKLTGGEHGRSNAGNFYELGQGTEVTLPAITFGHEMAHVILGAPDEYADPEHPKRNVKTDHSLMGDFYKEGFAGAAIKDRHFQYLIPYIQKYYPDRKITIVP